MCFCWYFVSLSQVRYEHPYQEKGDRKVSLFLVRATGLEEGGTANGGEKTCLRHVF